MNISAISTPSALFSDREFVTQVLGKGKAAERITNLFATSKRDFHSVQEASKVFLKEAKRMGRLEFIVDKIIEVTTKNMPAFLKLFTSIVRRDYLKNLESLAA